MNMPLGSVGYCQDIGELGDEKACLHVWAWLCVDQNAPKCTYLCL